MNTADRHALALTILDLDRQISDLEARRSSARHALLGSVARLAAESEEYPDGVRVSVVRAVRASLDRSRLAEMLDLTPEELSSAWEAASVPKPVSPHIRITSRR